MKLIKYKTLWKSQLRKGDGRYDTDMMSNIIEIQDIWNLLYKSKSSTFGSDSYGKGFVYRPYTTNTRKETLNDYIYASNRGSGTYTARVTKKTLMWLVIQPYFINIPKVYQKKRWTFSTIVVLQRYLNLKKIVLRVSRLVRVVNGKVKRISMF
jgi:hypothetical protein